MNRLNRELRHWEKIYDTIRQIENDGDKVASESEVKLANESRDESLPEVRVSNGSAGRVMERGQVFNDSL